MFKHFLSLLMLLMLSLPGLPGDCAQKCEQVKATCCCCSTEDSKPANSGKDCCAQNTSDSKSNSASDRDAIIKHHVQISNDHSHNSCAHECSLSSAGDIATSISIQQFSAPVAATSASADLLPAFELQEEVVVQQPADDRMPLHLASNKIYLRNRYLLI